MNDTTTTVIDTLSQRIVSLKGELESACNEAVKLYQENARLKAELANASTPLDVAAHVTESDAVDERLSEVYAEPTAEREKVAALQKELSATAHGPINVFRTPIWPFMGHGAEIKRWVNQGIHADSAKSIITLAENLQEAYNERCGQVDALQLERTQLKDQNAALTAQVAELEGLIPQLSDIGMVSGGIDHIVEAAQAYWQRKKEGGNGPA